MKSIRLSEGIPSAGTLFGAALLAALSFAAGPAFAAPQSSAAPSWLLSHVGAGAGQIAAPVLERARDLYLQKSAEGKIHNSCYFAMDATRPNEATASPTGGRFYIICEAAHTFRVISSGHGSGRNLKGVADFSNGRACARNFGNAQDSNLTMGGSYITGEAKTSYRGYYQLPGQPDTPLLRTFIQFNGEGETATPAPAQSAAIRRRWSRMSAARRIRKALTPITTAMCCAAIWSITPSAAAMAAPAGRRRTRAMSFR